MSKFEVTISTKTVPYVGISQFETIADFFHSAADERYVLDDISLFIPAGQTTGIVGRTGRQVHIYTPNDAPN